MAQLAAVLDARNFLDWQPADDLRYELRAGHVVAMAPARPAHQILAAALTRYLHQALDHRPECTVRAEGSIVIDEQSVYVPDIAVTCRPHQTSQTHTEEPLLVVEVLSPSTESKDRRIKLPAYRAMPSMQEIVLIAQDARYGEVHRRHGDHWITELARGKGGMLRLATLDVSIPLESIYSKVDLDEDESEAAVPSAADSN